MEANPLARRGRGSEEEYFRKVEAERIAGSRRETRREEEARRLASELGLPLGPEAHALLDFGVDAERAPAFFALPLVEVAWADGAVDADERWRVLEAATGYGVELGRPSHALLEHWLESRPAAALVEVWHTLAAGGWLARDPCANRLLEQASAVAASAGGVLGFATISRAERRKLDALERSLAGVAAGRAA